MNITFIYITNRRKSQVKWFIDGLTAQLKKYPEIKSEFIMVNYWNGRPFSVMEEYESGYSVQPLPSPFQGAHQITSQTYFDASNARNTGIARALYEYIVFIDDLSVIGEFWLDAVIEAATEKYVVFGAYRKDKSMVVENGKLISSSIEESGLDSRRNVCGENEKLKCSATMLFGCSFGMPLELALEMNGFSELCATMGYEDVEFAHRLEKTNVPCYYDRRMLTIECAECHSNDVVMIRRDPVTDAEKYFECLNKFGIYASVYPADATKDCSHALVDICSQQTGVRAQWNFFDLRELRNKINGWQEITLSDMKFPERWWFTGELIAEM